MVDTKEYVSETNPNKLCETFSAENFKLKQVETDIVYGSSVIDVIEGYDENGKPYSRFTYIETDEIDPYYEESTDETEDMRNALHIMGVD